MERKLKDYWPPVVKDLLEMQSIADGEQTELEVLWEAVQDLFDDQFVESATMNGIHRWEEMLRIQANSKTVLLIEKQGFSHG